MAEKVAKKSYALLGEPYIVRQNKSHDLFFCSSCRKKRRTNPLFFPSSNPQHLLCSECYNMLFSKAQTFQQKNAELLPEGTELYKGKKRHACKSPGSYFNEEYRRIYTEKGVMPVCIYKCTGCGKLFVKGSNYNEKTYDRYKIISTSKMSQLLAEKINHVHFSQRKIAPTDFLTRSSVWSCTSENHEIKDIEAMVRVINNEHIVSIETIPAFYCKSCNRFYILEADYRELRKKGVILCNVVEINYWLTQIDNDFYITNSESLLHKMGYNVSMNDSLSAEERHAILYSAISSGLLTKAEVLSHLDYLIRRSQNQKRLFNAIEKWKQDRLFVQKIAVTRSNGRFEAITIIHKNPQKP